jgi:endonuclease/exonuclease/phosphatase family metal-dependent hydrolase
MAWNIKSGGFDSYDPDALDPERQEPIQQVIANFRVSHEASAVALTDAFRWDEVYGGDEGIADHMGYPHARFVRIEDERLNQDNGAGIGIAFATTEPITQTTELDLGTRKGLGVVLDIGRYGLQLANVYLDDMDEDRRIAQMRALLSGLEPDLPTIIQGDFNSLRSSLESASLKVRVGDLAVRTAAVLLPKNNPLGASIRSMNERRLIPYLEEFGYRDADGVAKRPTAIDRLPAFGIDYAFHNSSVAVSNFNVLPVNKASDHRAITYNARVGA